MVVSGAKYLCYLADWIFLVCSLLFQVYYFVGFYYLFEVIT